MAISFRLDEIASVDPPQQSARPGSVTRPDVITFDASEIEGPRTAPQAAGPVTFDLEDIAAGPPARGGGMLEPGNINLGNRPRVKNPDGTVSTVRSISINEDGREILIPTVSDDGRILSDDDAIGLYRQTGRHLGVFDSPESATRAAKRLHDDQAAILESQHPEESREAHSLLSRLTTPLIPQIATGAQVLARTIDPSHHPTRSMSLFEQLSAGAEAIPDVARNLVEQPGATLRGLAGGVVEGAGQVASQLTSPLDAALTLTGLRGVRAALPMTARTVQTAGNLALGARGLEQLATAETTGEAGAGALETALAAAGMRGARSPRTQLPEATAPAVEPPARRTVRLRRIGAPPTADPREPPVLAAGTPPAPPISVRPRGEAASFTPDVQRDLMLDLARDPAAVAGARAQMRGTPEPLEAPKRLTGLRRLESEPALTRPMDPIARDLMAPSLRRIDAAAASGAPIRPIATPEPVDTLSRAPGAPRPTVKPGAIDDPMRGVEPFLEKFPEPMRDGLRQVLRDNQGFADQRREVMPHELTDQLAEQIAVDVSRTLPKGTALNAEQLRAYANATATTQQKVRTLAEKVNTGQATDADRVALAAAQAEHATVLASMMGARAEAGRALSSFNMFARVLDTGDGNLIRAALKAPGVQSDLDTIARQIAALPDNPLARYEFLKTLNTPTAGEKLRSYYYANILSGVKTHERNFIGNAFNALTNLATTPAAAAVDVVKSRASGASRTVFLGEVPHQTAGAILGTQRGLRDFVFTLRHGVSPHGLTRTVDTALTQGQFDLPRTEFAGGGRNPFNWPGRMLDATDTLFRSIARNQEWYGQAYAQARREGVKGPQLTDRIAELRAGGRSNDTADATLAARLSSEADEFARRAVFQEDPGTVARWLQQGTKQFPPLAFVIPFIKTPANILRQGLEFSPAGALMTGARQPGRAGTQAQARVAMGTLALAPLAWLASTGRISGSGPQDPAERAALMEAGWRPNSIKLALPDAIAQQLASRMDLAPTGDGEYWVSYQLFQPVSVPMSIVANAFESWQAEGEKGPPSTSTVATAAMRSVRSVLDQSFLSGLFDVLEAIDNPDAWASRWLARTAHSLTPFAGAQRSVQQALDPTVRQPQGFTESLQANVPGLSTQVPARIDRFGEPVTRPGNAIARAADPFNTSPVKADPIAHELQRLGVDISVPNSRIELESGRVLAREDEQRVKQTRGKAVREGLALLFADPAYARLEDDEQRRLVLRIVQHARTRATKGLKATLTQPTR